MGTHFPYACLSLSFFHSEEKRSEKERIQRRGVELIWNGNMKCCDRKSAKTSKNCLKFWSICKSMMCNVLKETKEHVAGWFLSQCFYGHLCLCCVLVMTLTSVMWENLQCSLLWGRVLSWWPQLSSSFCRPIHLSFLHVFLFFWGILDWEQSFL